MYPKSVVRRQYIKINQLFWDDEYKNYSPPYYTAIHTVDYNYYDPLLLNDTNFKPKWNDMDSKVNRKSFLGNYIVKDSYPQNPIGRTGIRGRGLLGRWGPNHAADAIVTRWKRNDTEDIMLGGRANRKMLEFVAVLTRRSAGEKWAIPGGMVNMGETAKEALKREFLEETMHYLGESEHKQAYLERQVSSMFEQKHKVLYTGYCDDPRNTDNAWLETTALHFHDEFGNLTNLWDLAHGDDATDVAWLLLNHTAPVSETHHFILSKLASQMKAYWWF